MNSSGTGFSYTETAEPHRARTKALLKAYPGISRYIGKNPYTFLVIVGLVALQIALAFLMRHQPWWIMVLAAYTVGAFANHALFVMVHECAHNLIFRKRIFNTLASILANLPQAVPSAVSFQKYHLKHHAFQGVYELDGDIPSAWEARLVGHAAWAKALWLLLFPFYQITRPFRLKEIKAIDRWVLLNGLVQLGFDLAVYVFFGPGAFLYLVLSLFFSIGLHPLGARWIQRHYLVHPPQETYSYYGPLNLVAFNVGYHNEHHDFPSVPWNRLPRVREAGRQYYDGLVFHTSWTKLLFKFLFDPSLSLFSRMVRHKRGSIPLDDEVKPDIDLLQDMNRGMPPGNGS